MYYSFEKDEERESKENEIQRKSGDNNAATVNNRDDYTTSILNVFTWSVYSFLVNVLNYNKKWINSSVHILTAMNLFFSELNRYVRA